MFNIQELKSSETGSNLIVLGNSGYLHDIATNNINTGGVSIIGTNASPAFAAKHGLFLKYHVLFDWRFLNEKSHLVLPYLDPNTICLWGDNVNCIGELASETRQHIIHFLGYEGFSHDIAIGCFSGHTVAHVGLQIARYLGPERVFLLGVDLDYSITNTRFYQSKRGHDVELHVRGLQLSSLASGANELSNCGIEVNVVGKRSLLRGYVDNVSFDEMVGIIKNT
jgi:hypothetical protein